MDERKARTRVPLGLPIAGVILLILGLTIGPLIRSRATEEQLAQNVLLSAAPFILVFVAILLFFMSLVWLIASALNHQIPRRIYQPIEWFAIGGIVVGIVGLFQPWSFLLFRYSFTVLLFFTLFFILWSHVLPRRARREEELSTTSISRYERADATPD
jgi:hypothetical protein